MTITSSVPTEIVEFAAQVREQLSDLPAEDLDDLTEGLEADLAEAYREDLARELPDPLAYATELRLAAGLPPAADAPARPLRRFIRGVAELRRDVAADLRTHSWFTGIADVLLALRPVWWIVRALVAYEILDTYQNGDSRPSSTPAWLLLLAMVAVSVLLGTGHLFHAWLRWPLAIANTMAVLLLPLAAAHYDSETVTWDHAEQSIGDSQSLDGVYLDGDPVTNIFAYDANGKALTNVQLFTQDGKDLTTSVPGGSGCVDTDCTKEGIWAPSVLANGQKVWNVYPMRMVPTQSDGELSADPTALPQKRPAPLRFAPTVDTKASNAAGLLIGVPTQQ